MNPDEDDPNKTPPEEPAREEPIAEESAPELAGSEPEPASAEPEPQPEPALDSELVSAEPVRIEEAPPEFSEELYEPPPPAEPRYQQQPAYDPPPSAAHEDAYASMMAADPDIPMPSTPRRGDKQRARDARINLDLDLGRIKRRKRYGLLITSISVLFIALVLAPVTWAGAYLFFDPPSTMLMMQRASEGQTIRHYPIPINRMSPHIVRAVIAAEDANFCTHDGFDVEAIQDAMESNARGGRTRGASTISQQTAKNLFLWPERSWVRKGFETYFTALIEFMWPKRRIMEAYLNAAEWGDGNFGIEAAARARFGVSAADLTPLQAARLAAVLPSPNRWRADSPGPYVRRRSASIVERARVVRNERMASCALIMDRADAS